MLINGAVSIPTLQRGAAYLRVMGAHRSVALEGASGVAVAGVGEGVVFDLVVPRLYQLKDGPIAAKRIPIRSFSVGGICKIKQCAVEGLCVDLSPTEPQNC